MPGMATPLRMARRIERVAWHVIWILWLQALLVACVTPGDVTPRGAVLADKRIEIYDQAMLKLYVDEPELAYERPETFRLEAFFENRGRSRVLILPSLIHRQYRPVNGETVTYVPYPGPRLSPWDGAFALDPNETRVVILSGMRERDGLWKLDRGAYSLSLRYVVPEALEANEDASAEESPFPDTLLWVGELQSQEVTVRYEPFP